MGQTVGQWDLFETEFSGPADGNPFTDVELEAEFSGPDGRLTEQSGQDARGKLRMACHLVNLASLRAEPAIEPRRKLTEPAAAEPAL